MTLKKIEIQKEVTFRELSDRLRNVRLRGFPDVRIYEYADISIKSFSPKRVQDELFTPQPSVYGDILNRIDEMKRLFLAQGINISRLNGGIDYIATDENDVETNWTIIPPVAELVTVSFNGKGMSYNHNIGSELQKLMDETKCTLNPELKDLDFPEFKEDSGIIPLLEICDGSHRIHHAFFNGLEQNILVIQGVKTGFPYYAAPKPYNTVRVVETRDEYTDKTHVLTDPAHKLLYRSFPTGGINCGDIRPTKRNFI